MQTVVRILPRGQITIPNKMRKNLNLEENSLLEVEQTEQGLLLKPITMGQFKTDFKKIRQSWERYQDEIGQALDVLAKLPRNKRPLLFQ
ncbi:AbrB/MazE/SpoVT family DNA-binding domain-containing protein [Candidatus Curtissbacteria bacterium]|nr:AbrB/MazE/SpoVT family DNA-binding domain-containing protein [Candidatus Curtissbacteria bacterium]